MTSRASWMRPTTGRATSSSPRISAKVDHAVRCPHSPRRVAGRSSTRCLPSARTSPRSSWRASWPSCAAAAPSSASVARTVDIASRDGLGDRPRRCLRPIDGPLARVRGERPEATSCDRAATHPQGVWIFVRASSRALLEHGSLPEVLGGNLPGTMPPPERRSQRLASEPHARPADASAPQRSRARARASRLAMKGTTQIRQYGVLASLKRLGEAGGEVRGRSGQIASSLADE